MEANAFPASISAQLSRPALNPCRPFATSFGGQTVSNLLKGTDGLIDTLDFHLETHASAFERPSIISITQRRTGLRNHPKTERNLERLSGPPAPLR